MSVAAPPAPVAALEVAPEPHTLALAPRPWDTPRVLPTQTFVALCAILAALAGFMAWVLA